MDLLNITSDTQSVDIAHPGTGKTTGLVIQVTSLESDAVKKVERRQQDKRNRARRGKMSAADIETFYNERLCATVAGWEWNGDASWGGEKLDFNEDNVARVMQTPWVRSQIEEVLADEAGFFKN